MISIHDPIHGTIEVTPQEIRLIDTRPFQRLRHIKQLGFAELAFPGATHTRYTHSLGAMHIATGMATQLLQDFSLAPPDRGRLIQTVRLAMLFHDLGHPPMGHVTERVMPLLCDLHLGPWADDPERRATHEDFTIKLLVDSELTGVIEQQLASDGISGARLAALISGRPPPGDPQAFVVGGIDFLPLLSQIVSSELDADRMDYLERDAYYCGVSYGQFDRPWLSANLRAVEWEGRHLMALQHKGVWAFENFLLARFHMFLAVYYHHTAICFDNLLLRYFESGEYTLPPDTAGYLETDDVHLLSCLRASRDPWADHLVRRRAYRLLVETHDFGDGPDDVALDQRLREAGIDFFRVRSRGVLSKYFKKRDKVFPLLLIEPELSRVQRIEEYTPLYRRFENVIALSRVYCQPAQLAAARATLRSGAG